ncbi:LuxR C-terminal-related transcriptional regulator [Streptomyces sp. NBC_01017]|uniref:helix-turn-helix transcriptional regulator n=1 Tax=Streptomyces sp. NBC_01017 TaxID=2903721 RepID=UPI0038681F56|nr:LuxR C-terminal-related transcriptional regulator [Streptomyces sp. NBC_01017]WSV34946.1 LuxR C-terminal-related transcriptional regulator [Streptomyces sp. NBC_01017]
MSGVWETGFAGREEELETVARCRGEAVAGRPWLVVVEGASGIGKSALVRRALAPGKDGMRACWAGCDRSEQDLPYGVVDRLLRRLPAGTSGVQELAGSLAPAASPLAVGADLLAVVAAVSDGGPLAVVVDDVPWADEQSVKALGFMVRRLFTESVLVVLIARTGEAGSGGTPAGGGSGWQGLARGAAPVLPLRLKGLGRGETARIVAGAGFGGLGRAAVDRLHEWTAGHPLYLLSLLAEVTPEALADRSRPLPVPSSLEAVIRKSLGRLPQESRRLVEALAVLDTTVPLGIAAQLADLTDASGALGPALALGLLRWQPDNPTTPLRIHHPLQRNAVYQALSPTRRRALHAVAATLVGADQAWAHKVAAASGAAAQSLVEELAAEADRLADHGYLDRAATLELWAADLSPTRDGHEHHLLTAATHLLVGELPARALTLRDAVEHCVPTARCDAILGRLASVRGDFDSAEQLLTHAVATASDAQTHLLASTWLGSSCILQIDGAGAAAALRPVVDAVPAGPAACRARGSLATAVGFADGPRAGLEVIAEAGLPEHADSVPKPESKLLYFRGLLRMLAGQLSAGAEDLTTLIARQHADANIPVWPSDHYALALARYLTGHPQDAAISAEQSLLVADTAAQPWGLPLGHAVAVLVHALQGRWEPALEHLGACRRTARTFPAFSSFFLMLAEATLAQARADHRAMLQALRPLDDPTTVPPGMRTSFLVLWAPLLIEAVTADQQPLPEDLHRAEDALHASAGLARNTPALTATSHWLHARLAAAHGDTTTALTHYQAGINAPTRAGDDIPLHRAFLHHDLARHLLATDGDRTQATNHLRLAHKIYTTLGATPYTQRAADDLTRLHPHTHPTATPTHLPANALTEREHHVAHLAAQGMTNQEIAKELFLSPKTIEYHLSHVYTKLDLTSRRQLRALQFTAA